MDILFIKKIINWVNISMRASTKHSINTLSLCISAILLSACGESSQETIENTNAELASTGTPMQARMLATNSAYPEPTKDMFVSGTLGFYDQDLQGNERIIRNDLAGSFSAMIQFAQNHTVDPNGNEAKQMPRLTSEKDALLLVTPTAAMGDIQQLNAEIYLNSRLIRRITLQEPSQIPLSDQSNNDNRARVEYSKKAWTAALNWDEVKPGLNIRIVDPNSRMNGRLAATAIDFAGPGELVVQSIRLGMLTDPPNGQYYFLNQPAQAGTDYLQTIPAAQITVSKYDDMVLNKVMVANGKIYDTFSETDGDVYSGDMRENTAKSTFSTGINLANWGVTSAGMVSQQQPQLTQSVVIHHARGRYQNGLANHGLSGGNGILTLIDSIGNEFSHEIGHHYGLGHYPGQNGDNYFWASHHADSGWGYIAYRNRMRGNLNWNVTNLENRLNGTPLFQNKYIYSTDAMSGGNYSSSLSSYTHYTGYSTFRSIQPAFNRAVWDASSPTGYKQWNSTTRQMDIVQPKVPTSNQVWYNSANGNYLKPAQFGVPVFTILGGYDPVNNTGLLYPAARGNWGNVFALPQVDTNTNNANCWAHVTYTNKAPQNIALAPIRMGSNANKLHINLAQSDLPRQVDLYCKKENEQAIQLSHIDIPDYATPLPSAVIIGKAQGFSAIRQLELPELDQALQNNQNKSIATLTPNQKVLYDAYKTYTGEFSSKALTELKRYEEQQNLLYRLNRWINVYRTDLTNNVSAANIALKNFVSALGLSSSNPMTGATMLIMPNMNAACMKTEISATTGLPEIFVSGKNGCDGSASTLWIHDAIGKIHSVQYPEYCLSGASLAQCNNNTSSQVWETPVTGSTQQFRQNNSCLDLSGGWTPTPEGRGKLITYGCGSGNNQKWTITQKSQNFILAAATGQNLPLLNNALNSQ